MSIEWWQLAFAAFTSIMMAIIGAWAQIQNRKWETRTRKWEEITQNISDKSDAAAATDIETQELIRKNTEITQNLADDAGGVVAKLKEAAARSQVMRDNMKKKIASASDKPQTQDALDNLIKKEEYENQ